jgi:hypothetical protein
MLKRWILFLLVWFALLTGCAPAPSADPVPVPAPTPTPTPQPAAVAPFRSPDYGVHTSFWWRPEIVWRDLDLVREMGFGWVKQPVAWREIEGVTRGHYDWYRLDEVIIPAIEERGLKLLVRLDHPPYWAYPDPTDLTENSPPGDYADFGAFCGALATRYSGRIQAYQVWNEPNLHREWGMQTPDPVAYTALLRSCYTAIKAADPDAIVISAGLAPTATHDATATPDTLFLQGMYDAGAAAWFDVLGLNAPGYKAAPDSAPEMVAQSADLGGNAEFAFRHVETMRDLMVANGDGHKQVAILETGWITHDPHHERTPFSLEESHPSYAWFAVDEATQARYLVEAYRYARENWQPWIGLITTIYIADFEWQPDTHEQWWWAIVLPDGTPRPAWYALRDMPKDE